MNEHKEQIVEIQILQTTDLHGRFSQYDYTLDRPSKYGGGLAALATKIKALRKEYAHTYLLDTGDALQGNHNEFFLHDVESNPIIKMFNALEYDAFTLGNHEFNFGTQYVQDCLAELQIPVLAANIYNERAERIAKPYLLLNKGGVRVAIVGMVTENVLRWDCDHLEGYTVVPVMQEMQKIWPEIEDKADVYIFANHQPWYDQYSYGDGYEHLVAAYPQFQVVLISHSHRRRAHVEDGRAYLQSGCYGGDLGQIVVRLRKAGARYVVESMQSHLYGMDDVAEDPPLLALVEGEHQRILDDIRRPVGRLVGGSLIPMRTLVNLNPAQVESTALIALMNDVQRFYGEADVSLATLFHIDINLREGEINRADVLSMYRHSNTLRVYEVSGLQIKKILEWSARYFIRWREGDLTIAFNPQIPVYEYAMLGGMFYDINIGNEVGHRIEHLRWPDGRAVGDEERVRVAMDDFRAKGFIERDLFFEDASVLLVKDFSQGTVEKGQIRDYLMAYIGSQCQGIITNAIDGKKNFFQLTGYDWDKELRAEAVRQINAGLVEIPTSENGLSFYSRAIRKEDLQPF